MQCPNLVHKERLHCHTTNDSYRPSHYQLKEYCHALNHTMCPFYLGFRKVRMASGKA